MPKTIEKVPNELPKEIQSLKNMFYDAKAFNQNISKWDTSNVTNVSYMFAYTQAFNQDISGWNINKVLKHYSFSINSEIDNTNKLPKFKN